MLARRLQQPVREIVYRTRGLTHGPITRLMSPGDLGELLKPFVFLDLFVIDGKIALPPIEMGWHPHSGIATVSVILEGAVRYAETTGKHGVLQAGSIEWMRAGSGVWHTGSVEPGGDRIRPRFGSEATARSRARQLLGAHERRGVAPGGGGDSTHRT